MNIERLKLIKNYSIYVTSGLIGLLFIATLNFVYSRSELSPAINSNIEMFFWVMVMIFGVFFCSMTASTFRSFMQCSEILTKLKKGLASMHDARSTADEAFNQSIFDEEFKSYRAVIGQIKNGVDKNGLVKYKYISSKDSNEFINEDVLFVKEHFSIYNYIPHIFISIGIFGTFFGIVSGLEGLGDKFIEATTGDIRAAVGTLLNGVQISFRSSLYGILFSVLFAFYYKIQLSFMNKVVYELSNVLNSIFPLTSSEENLHKIQELLENQTSSIQKLAVDLVEGISETMSKEMSQVTAKLDNSLSHMANSVSTSVSSIGTESIENIAKPLSQIVDSVTEQYQKNQELLTSIKEYNDQFFTNVKTYEGTSKTVVTALTTMKERFDQVTEELLARLLEATELSEASTKDSIDYIDTLQYAIDKYKEDAKAQISAFSGYTSSIEMMTDKLNGSIESIANYIADIAKGQDSNIKILESQQSMVNEIQKEVQHNLSVYNEKVNSGMMSIFTQYDHSSSNILGKIDSMVSDMADSIDLVVANIEMLNNLVSSLNQPSEEGLVLDQG